jgi:hypothetical protein
MAQRLPGVEQQIHEVEASSPQAVFQKLSSLFKIDLFISLLIAKL